MKLLYTVTSPIARKCRIIARELNLMDKVEYILWWFDQHDSKKDDK